jgi:hypothetical protein
LVVATAALASSAPPAHADTQYGGHGLHKGTRPANPSITVVRRDDGSIAGRVLVGARCRGYANYSLVVRLSGRTPDGVNFTAAGRTRLGRGFVRVDLTGTLGPDSATGSARVRTSRCGSYRNPFSLRTPSAPVGTAAVPAPSTLMFGFTSQAAGGMGLPVAIRVSTNGRVSASTQSMVQCGRMRLPVYDLSPTRTIRPDGTFRGTQKYTIRYRGLIERYRVTMRGQFHADGATGTLSVTLRQRTSKRRYPACRSGRVTWAARA